MATVDSGVANLVLPLPVGSTDAPIVDPTIDGMLGYLGYWIKWGLDAKLATITKPTIADACPTANRYGVNPKALAVVTPGTPALFVWWEGKSKVRQWTTVRQVRDRQLQILYVFGLVKAANLAEGASARMITRGILSVVDGLFTRAFERLSHSGYAPSGFAAGTDIRVGLGLNAAIYQGGQEDFLPEFWWPAARKSTALSPGSKQGQAIQSVYPALRASILVTEEVQRDTPQDSDLLNDIGITIRVNEQGDFGKMLEVLDRVLEAPDGSEDDRDRVLEPGDPEPDPEP